jgi:uncharacterized protein YlaI
MKIRGKDGTEYPDYATYLQSSEWRRFRQERIDKDHHRCVICGSRDNLNVHHLNYKVMYEVDWLVTLCRDCHSRLHKEILPALEVDLKNLNDRFMPVLEKCVQDYEKEKQELFLSYCQKLSNGRKFADKCRAIRTITKAEIKGSYEIKIYFGNMTNSILKMMGSNTNHLGGHWIYFS